MPLPPPNFTQNCKNCLQERIRKVPIAILGLRLSSVRFSFVSIRHSGQSLKLVLCWFLPRYQIFFIIFYKWKGLQLSGRQNHGNWSWSLFLQFGSKIHFWLVFKCFHACKTLIIPRRTPKQGNVYVVLNVAYSVDWKFSSCFSFGLF